MRRYLFTIGPLDVGKTSIRRRTCDECGRVETVYIAGVIGPVQPIDIGKRVYNVGGTIQVENNEQRDARLRDGGAS